MSFFGLDFCFFRGINFTIFFCIHRSGLPHPEIEVLYTVYQDEEPIPANLAVEALQEVEDSDVEQFLGLPLVVKAEPYLARPQHAGPHVMPDEGKSQYLMAALIVSAFVIILVVLALVFLLHKVNMNYDYKNKHKVIFYVKL